MIINLIVLKFVKVSDAREGQHSADSNQSGCGVLIGSSSRSCLGLPSSQITVGQTTHNLTS